MEYNDGAPLAQGNKIYLPPNYPPPMSNDDNRPPVESAAFYPAPNYLYSAPPYPPEGYSGLPIPLPEGPQAFHPQLGDQYEFQYSQCTGRCKVGSLARLLLTNQALLIGINYFGSSHELHGCINDVRNVKQFIHRYGFMDDDMVILTDDQVNPLSIPTKANMVRAMQWLVRDAQPHDSLFFHYSGHGGQSVNWASEQDDIYEETIYPVDFKEAGTLINYVCAPHQLNF